MSEPSKSGLYEDLGHQQVFHIPHDRHQNFVGRDAAFEEIERRNQSEQCIVLSGIGGMGQV